MTMRCQWVRPYGTPARPLPEFLVFLRRCRASLAKQYDAADDKSLVRERLLYVLGELALDIRAVRVALGQAR